jgi:hypothetical protein
LEIMSDPQAGKRRRRLAPSEKYELFVQILTQQATQREAAATRGVDRSTVVHICRVAKQGALDALAVSVPGRRAGTSSPEQVELAAAPGRDRAAACDGHRPGRDAARAPGKIALGLTAGLVPPRVDAEVKAGLLDLVGHAVNQGGWSLRRAAVLGLDHGGGVGGQTRARVGELADRRPGPDIPVRALLDWERAAIVKLAEGWGEVDRSHRSWPPRLPAGRGARQGVHGAAGAGRRGPEAAGSRAA